MSTCISRNGEYSDHETEPGNYICDLCGALDEDRIFAALDRVKALAREWGAEGPSLISHAYSARDAWEGSMLERCANELRAAIEGP